MNKNNIKIKENYTNMNIGTSGTGTSGTGTSINNRIDNNFSMLYDVEEESSNISIKINGGGNGCFTKYHNAGVSGACPVEPSDNNPSGCLIGEELDKILCPGLSAPEVQSYGINPKDTNELPSCFVNCVD